MKPTSAAFSRVFRSSPTDWNRECLAPLSGRELEIAARLMGIPHTGTKAQLVERLLTAAWVREVLTIYTPDHAGAAEMAGHFKRKEMVDFARAVGAFYSLPKVGIAVSLLNWRQECRRRGQSFLRDWRDESRSAPRQLRLQFGE